MFRVTEHVYAVEAQIKVWQGEERTAGECQYLGMHLAEYLETLDRDRQGVGQAVAEFVANRDLIRTILLRKKDADNGAVRRVLDGLVLTSKNK